MYKIKCWVFDLSKYKEIDSEINEFLETHDFDPADLECFMADEWNLFVRVVYKEKRNRNKQGGLK